MGVLFSLEDRIIKVVRKDGGIVCDHEDGTRITRFQQPDQPADIHADEKRWYVRVECNGFATVTFDQTTKESVTTFGSGTHLTVQEDCTYKVSHWSGGDLHLTNEGAAVYHPYNHVTEHEVTNDEVAMTTVHSEQNENADENPDENVDEKKPSWVLRHNSPICCEVVDSEGNMFQVNNEGNITTYNAHPSTSEEAEEEEDEDSVARKFDENSKIAYQKKFMKHPPRLFIIEKNGSGLELLRHNDINDYMKWAEYDPLTAVVQEVLPGDNEATGVTVMRPHCHYVGVVWKVPKVEENIVPTNLRTHDLNLYEFRKLPSRKDKPAFGTTLGKGLSIGSASPTTKSSAPADPACPDALEVRQLVCHPEISKDIREALKAKFIDFVRDLGLQEIHRQQLQVQDPREYDEVMKASDLLSLVLQYDDHRVKENTSTDQAVHELSSADHHPATVDNSGISDQTPPQMTQLPDGHEPSLYMCSEYEANMKPKDEEVVEKAKSKLTESDWEVIRRQIMEERADRDSLMKRAVPSYFMSEEGCSWLMLQARHLNEASQEMSAQNAARAKLKKETMTVHLNDHDHKVYVGKRLVDKIHVVDREKDGLPSDTVNGQSGPPSQSGVRPNNPTPLAANPETTMPVSP